MRLLLILFFLGLSQMLQAAHIIGGVAHYEIIDISDPVKTEVEVTFTLYRDPTTGGAQFDEFANFGAYKKIGSGDFIYFEDQEVIIDKLETIQVGLNYTLEVAQYSIIFDLDKGSDYNISYQRCCRSDYISNINNSGNNVGFAIQLEIFSEGLELEINSPRLTGIPFVIAPLGQSIEYQLPFAQDSVIELTTFFSSAFIAGGTFDFTGTSSGSVGCCNCIRPDPSACLPPYEFVPHSGSYSGFNPLGDQNDIVIDTEGLITGVIHLESAYQYGIAIENRNNGTLLSRQMLDNVVNTSIISSTKEKAPIEFKIFPNPASDLLTIDATDLNNLTLNIRDLKGQSVLVTALNKNRNDISLSQLLGGTYFATIVDVKKVIS